MMKSKVLELEAQFELEEDMPKYHGK